MFPSLPSHIYVNLTYHFKRQISVSCPVLYNKLSSYQLGGILDSSMLSQMVDRLPWCVHFHFRRLWVNLHGWCWVRIGLGMACSIDFYLDCRDEYGRTWIGCTNFRWSECTDRR